MTDSQELARRIELEGAFNARDLGGLPAGPGRVVRTGRLFRSDSPQLLSDAAVTHLVEDLGLRTVLDLRYPDESAREGIGTLGDAPGVVHVNVPIRAVDHTVAPWHEGTEEVPLWEATAAYYQGYFLTEDGKGLVDAVKALAQADALPALVHCAAGKDRTGAVVAVVLSLVGVSPEDVAADYAETASAVPAILKRLAGLSSYDEIDENDVETHLTHPETMSTLLDWVETELGGVEAWLKARGVTDAELESLRDRLTEETAGD